MNRNIAIILGITLVFTVLAGCVQSNNSKTVGANSAKNVTNTTNQITNQTSNMNTNQSQTENITYENISNGTDLNDTTEVGYLNSSETPF